MSENIDKNKDIHAIQKIPRSRIYFPKISDVLKVFILVIITVALASGLFYGVNIASTYIIKTVAGILI